MADTLSGGPDGRRKVLQSFSGAETAASEDDEAAGLAPGNEENEAGCYFSPEKPCLPLSIEGISRI